MFDMTAKCSPGHIHRIGVSPMFLVHRALMAVVFRLSFSASGQIRVGSLALGSGRRCA